jgi:hypothetical protein
MGNRYINKYFTSLIIREKEIKNTVRYCHIDVRMTIIKNYKGTLAYYSW